MKYLRIKVIEDNMTGELGFKLNDNAISNNGNEFVAGNGLIIAHDIVEHVQGLKNIGTLEDELIACGAIAFTRGVTGNLGGVFFSGEESLSHDIHRMFEYYRGQAKYLKKYPNGSDEQFEYEFEWVDNCIQKSKVACYDDEDCENRYINEYHDWAKHLMKYGVWLAWKKYGCEYEALHLFQTIEREVDKYSPEYEGQEFSLGYTYKNHVNVVMKPIEERYDEW